MDIICFLDPETIEPFATISREKVPNIGEIIEIENKKYEVFKSVWFFGEHYPYIAIKEFEE